MNSILKKRKHCVYLVCTLLYILSTSSIPASEKINTKADPCWWSSMTVTYVAKTRVMEIQLTAGLKSTFLTVYLVGLAAERKWRCSSLKCHISVSRYLYQSIDTIDAVLKKNWAYL